MAPPGLQAEEKEEIKATQLIQKISYLSQYLLPSVPEATTDDKIYRVFTRIEDSEDDPYLPFNSLFEDVPEDDETPLGPVKDELQWIGILRKRRDQSVPLMHHFRGGRCVIILGFKSISKLNSH